MKFGHRGANHPVKNLETGKVDITSQNHGYAIDIDSLKSTDLEVFILFALNDGTVEGLKHKTLPAFLLFNPILKRIQDRQIQTIYLMIL